MENSLAPCRVLVAVEPELLRTAITSALEGTAGISLMRPEIAAAVMRVPGRRMLLHPSARPDVVIASPELARDLATAHLSAIAIDEDAGAELVAYANGTELARRTASMKELVALVNMLGGTSRAAASC
jgi:hypothetical protein